MAKVLIVSTFHRYVANPEATEANPLPELRDEYPAGKTVDASDEDAAAWIARGLAKPAEKSAGQHADRGDV